MDKLYTATTSKNTPKPSELSLELIKQFSASYSSSRFLNRWVDACAN